MRRARIVRPPSWKRFVEPRQRKGETYPEYARRWRVARAEWRDLQVNTDWVLRKGELEKKDAKQRRQRHRTLAFQGINAIDLPVDAFA